MCRGVGGIDGQGFRSLIDAQFVETEVVVDTTQARAASGTILIEPEPAPIHRAVVVQRDCLLHIVQRLDRPICRLLRDRIIEVGRRIFGVQLFGHRVLASVQWRAFLLEIGLAQIAPDDCIAWIQARGNLQFAASFIEFAVPDFRQPETEPRQRIRLIERDRLLESFPSLCGLDLS